jgi:hypothetical protein
MHGTHTQHSTHARDTAHTHCPDRTPDQGQRTGAAATKKQKTHRNTQIKKTQNTSEYPDTTNEHRNTNNTPKAHQITLKFTHSITTKEHQNTKTLHQNTETTKNPTTTTAHPKTHVLGFGMSKAVWYLMWYLNTTQARQNAHAQEHINIPSVITDMSSHHADKIKENKKITKKIPSVSIDMAAHSACNPHPHAPRPPSATRDRACVVTMYEGSSSALYPPPPSRSRGISAQ